MYLWRVSVFTIFLLLLDLLHQLFECVEGGCVCALLPMDEAAVFDAQYSVAGGSGVERCSISVAVEQIDGPMQQGLVVAYDRYRFVPVHGGVVTAVQGVEMDVAVWEEIVEATR